MIKSKRFEELIPQVIITAMAAVSIIIIAFIFIFIFVKALPVLQASGLELFTTDGFDQQISDAFNSTDENPVLKFGMKGLIIGTFLSTGAALLFATLIGIGASIIICEYVDERTSEILASLVRFLAAVPSVIFGLVGIIVIVPFVEKLFVTVDLQIQFLDYFQMTGKNLLSAIIILTFMIVPTIISVSIDAIKAVPRAFKEAGIALGMSQFRVVVRIVLPNAKSGLISGVILGAGRGIGEAIAVSMVCGGLGIIPNAKFGFYNLLAPTLPLSAAIINKSEAMGSMPVESALFSAAFILLLFGMFFGIVAGYVEKNMNRRVGS